MRIILQARGGGVTTIDRTIKPNLYNDYATPEQLRAGIRSAAEALIAVVAPEEVPA